MKMLKGINAALITDFACDEIEGATLEAPPDTINPEAIKAVGESMAFLHKVIFSRRATSEDGTVIHPDGRSIAMRWAVIRLLIGADERPLREVAREIGCTAAGLSAIGVRMSEKL